MVHMPLVLGVYLVFTKFLLGFYLVFTWCLFFYSVCTWFAQHPGPSVAPTTFWAPPLGFVFALYLVSMWFVIGFYVVFTQFLLGVYFAFTWFAQHPRPSMAPTTFCDLPPRFTCCVYFVCSWFVLGLYSVFTWCSLGVFLPYFVFQLFYFAFTWF